MAKDKSAITQMTFAERCELLETLWASIESDPEFEGIPDWHREILQQRLERMRNDPQPGYSAEDLFKKLAERRK